MHAIASTTRSNERQPSGHVRRGEEIHHGGPLASSTATAVIHRKAACACGGACPACQHDEPSSDLKVSQPHDAAEIEADRLADAVMGMPAAEPSAATKAEPAPPSRNQIAKSEIHRKCESCEYEEIEEPVMRKVDVSSTEPPAEPPPSPKADPVPPTVNHIAKSDIHRKCESCEDEEIEEPVMRKADMFSAEPPSEPPPGSGDDPRHGNNLINFTGGIPLDFQTREFFEPRFGIDLGHVRVHTGPDASGSARSLAARAYTFGNNIVFGAGEYSPSTDHGRHLLAHELAHVAQGAGPGRVMRKSDDSLDDFFESPDGGQTGSGGGGTGGCPKVPTHLGDTDPEPSCPKATHIGTHEVDRIKFCLDSDEPVERSALDQIPALVREHHPKTRFIIHGYASPEGRIDYNFNLACHRANRVAEEMHQAIRAQVTERLEKADTKRARGDKLATEERINTETGAEIQGRIETGAQGPTSAFGSAEENRLVIVYVEEPGGETDPEPECKDARRGMGNITPEIPCDLRTAKLDEKDDGPDLMRFRFCLDSDVLNQMTPAMISKFARAQASKATFVIHGFSSSEGAPDYNQRLSCHRALRVARELINAGVRAEQIREVSGRGETDKFGDADRNRVAIVHAEEGAVDEFDQGTRPASIDKEKQAIIDEARQRIISGQYHLAADAYISFWTCGRTRTVSQAVERLTIQLPLDDQNRTLRKDANGTEEGHGVNMVRLSNVALRADNAVECTMGRLIDMSFHHAELGNTDLETNPDSRHRAGLHLIHLAGLKRCRGDRTTPEKKRNDDEVGIDKPLVKDPREKVPPTPACTEAPQSTRLHFPTEGAKGREHPAFKSTTKFTPATGKLTSNFGPDGTKPMLSKPATDILKAEATVQLSGDPKTFADYEVGFIQSVIADEMQADYSSGHSVIQSLPVPIRHAHIRDGIPVPEPWTTLDSMKTPNPDGTVEPLSTTGINLHADTMISLGTLTESTQHKHAILTRFEKATRIAIWLIARRRGAPLDRFSIHVIDGATYDVTQLSHIEHRHVRGDMTKETSEIDNVQGEDEIPVHVGGFHTAPPSKLPENPAAIRLRGAVSSDIALKNQVKQIIAPSAPGPTAMDKDELTSVVKDILDNLEVFSSVAKAKDKTGGKVVPRLGFDFIRLDVTLPFMVNTGRLKLADDRKIVSEVKGPGLGVAAGLTLATAIELRLLTREAEAGAKPVIVRPDILKNVKEGVGTVVVSIPERKRDRSDPRETQHNLLERDDVLEDMAEAWKCTDDENKSGSFGREFGRAYSMDRDKKFIRTPSDRLVVSPEGDGEVIELNLPCPKPADGVTLGRFHTHPDTSELSPQDVSSLKTCGGPEVQHFLVFENQVFRMHEDRSTTQMSVKLRTDVPCRAKNFEDDEKKKRQ